MAIVIDAERPHACWACDYRCGLNIIARTEEEGVHDDCPIIGEIPDVHGRLIDVDRFMDDNADGFEMNWDNEKGETIGRIFAPFAPVKKALDKAPTIIEASKERK